MEIANVKLGCEKDETSESIAINFLIKEYISLKEKVENSNKKVQYWENETSKLLESNSNIEANYNKLLLKVADIDAKITENTAIHIMKKQELKELYSARTNISHKQWDDCLTEIGNYADNFSQWIVEYSGNTLKKNMENYHEQCKKTADELETLKRELNDIMKEYDSDDIKANVDINPIQNLNITISHIKPSNNNLLHAVKLTEDKLNKIQSKIKQSKTVVDAYKLDKKTNIF